MARKPGKKWYRDHLEKAEYEGGLPKYILVYGADFEQDPVLDDMADRLIELLTEIDAYLEENHNDR